MKKPKKKRRPRRVKREVFVSRTGIKHEIITRKDPVEMEFWP